MPRSSSGTGLTLLLVPVILILAGIVHAFQTQPVISTVVFILFIVGIIYIIRARQKASREKQELRQQALLRFGVNDDFLDLDELEFEELVGTMFQLQGFDVKYTPVTNDFGADLILTDEDNRKIVVQIKNHSSNVGSKAVQEVISAKTYYDADDGYVVISSYFTSSGFKLAEKGKIRLIDKDELIRLIIDVYKHGLSQKNNSSS